MLYNQNSVGKKIFGCFTFLIFMLIFISIVSKIVGIDFYEGQSFLALFSILFQMLFIYGIIRVVLKIIKSLGNTKDIIKTEDKTQIQKPETKSLPFKDDSPDNSNKQLQPEVKSEDIEDKINITGSDVLKAFALLGLTPEVSYTKVSERYYELIKNINSKKLDEQKRQEEIEKLQRAYEIITEYYAKKY
ncbi:MAG: hypothetical protein ACK4R7_02245 [Fervidobacterium sp.]